MENRDGTGKLFNDNIESEKMETDQHLIIGSTSSRIDYGVGKFGDRRERMARVVENASGDISDYTNEYRKLGRETFVKCLGTTSRYLSDICVPEISEEIVQFLADVRQLSRISSLEQLRLVSVHDTHIHVVHLCSYSNSACRCAWLGGSTIWRTKRVPKHSRRVFAADISATEWENIFRYFTTYGHAIQAVESGGSNERLCLRLKNLQVKN